MASEQSSCVCAVDRSLPDPESAGAHEAPFAGTRTAAVRTYFPLQSDLRNPEARGIAKGIVEQGRLAFAGGSSRDQRFPFIKHQFGRYHPDKNPNNPVVAKEVGIFLFVPLKLQK